MAEERLTAIVSADITQFTTALQTVQRAVQAMAATMDQAMQRVAGQVRTAQNALTSFQQATVQMTTGVQTLGGALGTTTTAYGRFGTATVQAWQAQQQLATQTQSTTQSLATLHQSTQQASTGASTLGSALTITKGVLGALGIQASIQSLAQLGKSVIQTATTTDQLTASFKAITGSAASAQATMAFVREQANRLGFDSQALAKDFRSIEATFRGTALQGQASRDIFIAMAEAGRVMGLSTEQMHRGLIAIEQIMSKGKVSAEELRQQLSEALPGAFQIAARAMGVSTEKLDDMLKKGQVFSTDFLPKFAAQVRKEMGAGVADAADTAVAAFARFRNAMVDLGNTIGPALLTPLARIAEGIAAVVREITGADEKAKAVQATSERIKGAGVGATTPQETSRAQERERRILALQEEITALRTNIEGVRTRERAAQQRVETLRAAPETLGRTLQLPGAEAALSGAQRQRLAFEEALMKLQEEHTRLSREATQALQSEVTARKLGSEGITKQIDVLKSLTAQTTDTTVSWAKMKDLGTKIEAAVTEIFQELDKQLRLLDARVRTTPALYSRDPQRASLERLAEDIAREKGIDPAVFRALIQRESGFNPRAIGAAGEQGLGQLMPATSRMLRVEDVFDPEQNLRASAEYFRRLQAGGRTTAETLAAYNAGPGRVPPGGGLPRITSTQEHVRDILASARTVGTMGGIDPLKVLEEKAGLVRETLEKINAELAKTPSIAENVPPVIQKQIDQYNALLVEIESQIAKIESTVDAEKDASTEKKKLLDQEVKDRQQAIDTIADYRVKILEQEIKDEQHARETMTKLRIDVAADERKVAEKKLEEDRQIAERYFQIQKDADDKIIEEQQRAQEELARFVAGIQRTLSNTLFKVFTGAKDIFTGIKELFFRLLADMAAAALTRSIVIPIVTQLIGTEGTGGVLGGLLGAGGQQTIGGTAAGAAGGGVTSLGAGAQDVSTALFGGQAGRGNPLQRAADALLNTRISNFNFGNTAAGFTQANAAFGGGARTQGFFGTADAAASSNAIAGVGRAPAQQGGGQTIGGAISAGVAGIGVGYATSEGLTALGLTGQSRSAGRIANTTISGAVGGAVAGAQYGGPYGAVIGAVVGAIGGLIAGFTEGQRDRQRFQPTRVARPGVRFDDVTGLEVASELDILSARTARLDRHTKFVGFEKIPEAANALFEGLVDQIKSLDPQLQKAAVAPLNAIGDQIAQYVDDINLKGKDQRARMQAIIEQELPRFVNDVFGDLRKALNRLAPVIAEFQEVIATLEQTLDALKEQEVSLRTSLRAQAKGIEEATFTDAQIYVRRRQELTAVQQELQTAPPQRRIELIPTAQDLIQEIFSLGSRETVLGQEPEAVRNLQQEMIALLRSLEGVSDESFAALKSDTQTQIDLATQQVELLAASVNNLGSVDATIRQSLLVLNDIREFMTTGKVASRVGALSPSAQASAAGVPITTGVTIYDLLEQGTAVQVAGPPARRPQSFQSGTPYVPRSGLAFLHQGEAVIPASQNAFVIPTMSTTSNQTSYGDVNVTVTVQGTQGMNEHALGYAIAEQVQHAIEMRARLHQTSLLTQRR